MNITHRVQLPSLMKELGLPLIAVECGTASGGSACDFMENGLDQIICVDNWATIPNQKGDASMSNEWHRSNFETAQKRLSKWDGNVKLLRGLTTEMSWMVEDNSVGMLYLDSDHSYEGVFKELICYFNKVVKGGIIAGHDFLQEAYGVKKAVEDFTKIYGYQWHLIPENKDEDSGFFFIKN